MQIEDGLQQIVVQQFRVGELPVEVERLCVERGPNQPRTMRDRTKKPTRTTTCPDRGRDSASEDLHLFQVQALTRGCARGRSGRFPAETGIPLAEDEVIARDLVPVRIVKAQLDEQRPARSGRSRNGW